MAAESSGCRRGGCILRGWRTQVAGRNVGDDDGVGACGCSRGVVVWSNLRTEESRREGFVEFSKVVPWVVGRMQKGGGRSLKVAAMKEGAVNSGCPEDNWSGEGGDGGFVVGGATKTEPGNTWFCCRRLLMDEEEGGLPEEQDSDKERLLLVVGCSMKEMSRFPCEREMQG
jgi:hypothetical protein